MDSLTTEQFHSANLFLDLIESQPPESWIRGWAIKNTPDSGWKFCSAAYALVKEREIDPEQFWSPKTDKDEIQSVTHYLEETFNFSSVAGRMITTLNDTAETKDIAVEFIKAATRVLYFKGLLFKEKG